MDKISVSKLKEYRDAFEIFDKNKDGSINFGELEQIIKRVLINENFEQAEEYEGETKRAESTEDKNGTNGLKIRSDKESRVLKEIISDLDLDGNDKIDFEEFVILMHKKNEYSELFKSELKNAFKVFDKDDDQKISNEDLAQVFSQIGEKQNEEEINEIIQDADLDNDGYINYIEFVEFLFHS